LHAKLCNKLLDRGFDAGIVKCLYFWWKHQQFSVKWGNCYSRRFITEKSVRQGGVMSPVLFNVYMDMLGQNLMHLGIGCKMGNIMANCLFYADDICLLSPSLFGLQRMLDVANHYASEHNITFNARKTVCMRFSVGKDSVLPDPDVTLNNNSLSWVDSYKYLGFTICNNIIKFDEAEMCVRARELRIRANMLCSRFREADNNIKKYLFQTYVGSIYCMSVWTPKSESNSNLNKVKVAYNDCIRLSFKFKRGVSVSTFCINNGILSFKELQRKLCFSMFNRIGQSHNLLVNMIKTHMYRNRDSLMNYWYDNLYSVNTSFSMMGEFLLN